MNDYTESHLYQEIHEQPDALHRLLQHEGAMLDELASEIRRRNVEHVVIAARGTSDNAGRYAKYLLGAVNGLSVALATPSLFTIYERPPRFGNALVLGISQSGKSPDIVSVLAEARRQGALTAAFTNMTDSDLSREADFVVGLHAGEEKSVAATKTYTTELAAVALLSARLAQSAAMQNELTKVPDAVAATLQLEEQIAQLAPRYRYMRHCAIIGRGYNYATAFELSLKLKELTYTIAEPYSSADFLHGPLALIDEGFPVFVVAPAGKMSHLMQEFIRTLSERNAEVVALSDENNTLDLATIPLRLPASVPEWLSPIPAVVPGQLLAMHLTLARHYDPDKPRAIRKVTETR